MGYDVYVQHFADGDSSPVSFGDVADIFQKYGKIEKSFYGDGLEFSPRQDICEIGYISGDEDSGFTAICFSRPRDQLEHLIFELLGIPGMCYFEQDVIHVLARSDITKDLPEGLVEAAAAGRLTVISSASEIFPD